MNMRIAVDIVIFTLRDRALQVLLVRRKYPPFPGRWAIPGGFVLEGESLDAAARRELVEETGVSRVYLEQLYTFGEPRRDPRGRVISVTYYALVAPEHLPIRAGSDASEAAWFEARKTPRLAFDHGEILEYAVRRLRNKLDYTPVGFQLLPERFTLTELQRVHETILARPLEKRNFRRKIRQRDLVRPLRKWRRGKGCRPARLYRAAFREDKNATA